MKVISMHQPWASWVALGWKTIETRTHNRFKNLVGSTIGIHATKHWDKSWRLTSYRLSKSQFEETESSLLLCAPRGCLIASAFVEDLFLLDKYCSPYALCDCSWNDLFGLRLSHVARIKPIPMKGFQGIWNYDGEIIYL